MYQRGYKRYERKKRANKLKSILAVFLLFLIGFGIAFLANQAEIQFDKNGIHITWTTEDNQEETLADEVVDEEILEDDISKTTEDEEEKIEPEVEQKPKNIANALYFETSQYKSTSYVQSVIDKFNTGEINSVVLSLKEYNGAFNYASQLEYTNINSQNDLTSVIKTLKDNGVYVIAEVYTNTDDLYATAYPQTAMMTESGYSFLDASKRRTINPYSSEGLSYITDIALEIEYLGVDEIILGGFHFTEKGLLYLVKYDDEEVAREDILVENLKNIKEAVQIPVSLRLSRSAILADSQTYENIEKLAEHANNLYIAVLDDAEKALYDSLEIENKGIISDKYRDEIYNNIKY